MPSTPTRLHIGAAFYPEHWPEEHWAEDIRLMRDAGLTVVRLAEFAWSSMEPVEGQFNFDWLERAIAQLSEAGILTVLGTPTAAPPAWLTQAHPETLAIDESGRRVQHGNRCHYCVNSSIYHAAARRIAEAMAERFGKHPDVTGWQIDNEFWRPCYCEICQAEFQRFLQSRYGDLETLNRRWSTAYWNQTYSNWEQIPIPRGNHNPGLMLEHKRFITRSYTRFQKTQIDSIRPRLVPGVWITHNFMGWFDGFDHYVLSEDLDIAAWDWYVGMGRNDYAVSGAMHAIARGYKNRNFWVMETQPNQVNWASVNNSLEPGETRALAWHAIGHGADAWLYWQWRPAYGGQEQYHGTLVDQSGQPRPFYSDVRALAAEFAAGSSILMDTVPAAQAALLYSFDSRWAIQNQRHHRDFDYVKHFNHYYRPLALRNIPAAVISPDVPLDGYKLVVAPALNVLTKSQAHALSEFARAGGQLVLTARTGMKDEANALLPMRQPGWLRDAAGVEVEDFYALLEPIPVHAESWDGHAQIWGERLKVLDSQSTHVMARYGAGQGWLTGQPVITVSNYGAGKVYFVGAYLDDPAQDALFITILHEAGLRPVLE
ncbi:MAG: beta-galactosidase, partial [Chloroflexota bacterium]|nr:beta-galactosidase [Chloroflexota bacterium]